MRKKVTLWSRTRDFFTAKRALDALRAQVQLDAEISALAQVVFVVKYSYTYNEAPHRSLMVRVDGFKSALRFAERKQGFDEAITTIERVGMLDA